MDRQPGCKHFTLFICILLACMLCFAVSAASADSDFEIEGTTLVKYTGNGGVVTVPDGITVINEWAFDSSAVTKVILPETLEEIQNYAFFDCTELEEITLPASLTILEYSSDDSHDYKISQAQVFYNNWKLQAINVAEGNPYYKSVDGVLFTIDEKKLLYYPAGKNYGGRYAIPEGTEELGYTAFASAELTSIELPSTLTTLYNGGGDFDGISGLLRISVAEGNPLYYSADGVLYDRSGTLMLYPAWKEGSELDKDSFPKGITGIGAFAFRGNQNLKSIEFPDGVLSVDWMAFQGARSLRSVTFPSSLSYVSGYIFNDCKKLERVTFRGASVTFPDTDSNNTGDDIFTRARSGLVLCGPEKSTVRSYADRWGLDFEVLDNNTEAAGTEAVKLTAADNSSTQASVDSEIPEPDIIVLHTDTDDLMITDEVEEADNSFPSEPEEADVPVPAEPETKTTGVFEIQDKTLYRYTGHDETVVIPDGIEVLGEWAFDGCDAKKIILPETLKEIQCYCFFDCPNLADITLPASLVRIDEAQAFNLLPSLKRFKVAQGNKNFVVVDGVLFSADRKTLLYYPDAKNAGGQYSIPEGTTDFNVSAFDGAKLTSIELPASLNRVSSGLGFSSMNFLKEITVVPGHPSCQSIDGVLYDLSNTLLYYPSAKETKVLGKEDFAEGIRIIGHYAFQNNQYIKTIEFPEGVESIGWMCFTWADALENVTVPTSVRSIDAFAFADCPNLKEVVILNSDANLRLDESKINEDYNFNIIDESPYARLCGYEGSTAQIYAEKLDLPFRSLGPAPKKDPNATQPDPEPTPVFIPDCME